MKTPQYLFELIKSLSEKEKNIILSGWKVKCSSSKCIYTGLFNELNKLDVYDEIKFLNDSRNQRFLKNFSYNKHYLYKKLLNSISDYLCDDGTTETILIEELKKIKYLISKGLYKQAKPLILKAEKISLKEEYYQEYIKIINYKKLVTLSLNKGSKLFQLTNEIYDDIEKSQKALEEINTASRLNNNLFLLYNSNGYYSEKYFNKELSSILRHEFYKNENKLSVDAGVYYYGDKFIHAMNGNDFEKSYAYAKKRYELVSKNKFYSRKYPVTILASLADLLHVLLCQKRLKKFDKYFKDFCCLNLIDYSAKKSWFYEKYFFEMQRCILKSEFEFAGKIYERFKAELKEYPSVNYYSNSIMVDLLILFSYSFLKNKNYTESLGIINMIPVDEFKGLSYSLFYSISILKIINYYKLDFPQNTLSEIKSLKRYLKLKDKLTETDVQLFELFFETFKQNKSRIEKNRLQKFYFFLKKIKPDESLSEFLFDFEELVKSEL